MRKLKLGAMALALALTTALPVDVPYTAGLIGTPVAEAGVISSIKGAAKKVGSAAKKVGSGVKTVGKGVARTAKPPLTAKGWRAIGGAAKMAARATGRTVKTVVTKVGHGVKVGAQTTWGGIKRVGGVLVHPAKFHPPGLPPRKDVVPKSASSLRAADQGTVARDRSVMGRPVGARKM